MQISRNYSTSIFPCQSIRRPKENSGVTFAIYVYTDMVVHTDVVVHNSFYVETHLPKDALLISMISVEFDYLLWNPAVSPF